MEIQDKYGSLIAAYSFPYSIVNGTAVNLAAANPANGYNPQQYNAVPAASNFYTHMGIVKPNSLFVGATYTIYTNNTSLPQLTTLTICIRIKNLSNGTGLYLGGQYNGGNTQGGSALQ